jgi:hypothetical protein
MAVSLATPCPTAGLQPLVGRIGRLHSPFERLARKNFRRRKAKIHALYRGKQACQLFCTGSVFSGEAGELLGAEHWVLKTEH